jgi:hypothetical protein
MVNVPTYCTHAELFCFIKMLGLFFGFMWIFRAGSCVYDVDVILVQGLSVCSYTISLLNPAQ